MRTHIPWILTSISCLLVAGSARAKGISGALGEPGSTTWDAECAAVQSGVTTVPWIDDPIFECDAASMADCMHRVDIDTDSFPNAVCNDGSPAAFYIHAGPPGETRWVIHLQGGGGCQSYSECLARWCGENPLYTASMMSTDWNADGIADIPDNIELEGMRLQAPANDFADYNHVFVYYCSSDGWVGTENAVTFSHGTSSMEMDVRGHSILLAVRHMLRRIGAVEKWFAVDGSTLPDLDLATEVLFTGTSAGGFGALMNADWFLSPLGGIDTALVLDAALEPSDAQLASLDVWIDTDLVAGGDVDAVTHRIDDLAAKWAPGGYFHAIDAFVDESCRAHYEPQGQIDRCLITSELLGADVGGAPAIETDTFVRMDLEDPVLSAPWLDGTAVIGSGGTTPLALENYRNLVRGTLAFLYNTGPVVTGAFAPRCARHVGLEFTKPMGLDVTRDFVLFPPMFGLVSTLHDALTDWWNAGGIVPTRYIDRATLTPLSTCAP